MSWKDYFAKGFGGNKDGSTCMNQWFPEITNYTPVQSINTWTTMTYTPRPRFYFCSRPGKRWKK